MQETGCSGRSISRGPESGVRSPESGVRSPESGDDGRCLGEELLDGGELLGGDALFEEEIDACVGK
jgi:hypothetical protein